MTPVEVGLETLSLTLHLKYYLGTEVRLKLELNFSNAVLVYTTLAVLECLKSEF